MDGASSGWPGQLVVRVAKRQDASGPAMRSRASEAPGATRPADRGACPGAFCGCAARTTSCPGHPARRMVDGQCRGDRVAPHRNAARLDRAGKEVPASLPGGRVLTVPLGAPDRPGVAETRVDKVLRTRVYY